MIRPLLQFFMVHGHGDFQIRHLNSENESCEGDSFADGVSDTSRCVAARTLHPNKWTK